MFKIHVFEVGLGDSYIIETNNTDNNYYSIVDCKKVGDSVPVVDFLQANDIRNIQSIFLTHLHQDHYSGFPILLKYLKEVGGTVEYLICPQLPHDVEMYSRVIECVHDQSLKNSINDLLNSLDALMGLPSLTHSEKKPMNIRLLYEGGSDWRTNIHNGLSFAPVNPSTQQSTVLITQAIEKNIEFNKQVNPISHAFLIKHSSNDNISYAFFVGDLEGKTWRTVTNRCRQFTQQETINTNLKFFKVPHHGSKNPTMELCLSQLINNETDFIASISCPYNSKTKPYISTITYLKEAFPNCKIACTNMSYYCRKEESGKISELQLLGQTKSESDFQEFALNSDIEIMESNSNECMGTYTVIIEDGNIKLSNEKECSFEV